MKFRWSLVSGAGVALLFAACAGPREVMHNIRTGTASASEIRRLAATSDRRWQQCALFGAVARKDLDLTRELIKGGITNGWTGGNCRDRTAVDSTLHRAVLTKDVAMVSLVAAAYGPNIDEQSGPGARGTALHLAVMLRYAGIVRALLNAGANGAQRTEEGETALDLLYSPSLHGRVEGLAAEPEIEAALVAAGVPRTDRLELARTRRAYNAKKEQSRADDWKRREEIHAEGRANERAFEREKQEAREAESMRIEQSRAAYQRERAAEEKKQAAPAGDFHLSVEAKSQPPPQSPPPKKYETPQPTPPPPSPPWVIKPCVKNPRYPKAACTIPQ